MSPHGALDAVPGAQTGGVRRPAAPPVRGRELLPGGGLCGGASHEAEGRCGARGASAGRVGPPTGWHRLRLLRQILDELVPGVEQFLLVDDVIAVEDGAALVPGQEHGNPLGDAGADQVAGGGAAAVVKEAGRHPSGLAGRAPRGAPAPDGDAVAVEDERAVGVAACPPPRQASEMGCEIGRIRPTRVFERAGESRMTPPASSISSQVRPRISCLRHPE